MLDSGEIQKEVLRPDFNRSIMIDFQGATISSDTGLQPSAYDPAILRLGRGGAAVHGVGDQAFNQSGRQGFLSCPAVVCACSLGFPSIAPLSGGAGLGSLSSTAVRYLGSGVWYAQIFEKITFICS